MRAGRLGDTHAVPHRLRIAAGKLHDVDVEPLAFHAQPRLFGVQERPVAGDHLGHDEARAEAVRQAAERQIGDAGHRREKGPARHRDLSDLQRLAGRLQKCSKNHHL